VGCDHTTVSPVSPRYFGKDFRPGAAAIQQATPDGKFGTRGAEGVWTRVPAQASGGPICEPGPNGPPTPPFGKTNRSAKNGAATKLAGLGVGPSVGAQNGRKPAQCFPVPFSDIRLPPIEPAGRPFPCAVAAAYPRSLGVHHIPGGCFSRPGMGVPSRLFLITQRRSDCDHQSISLERPPTRFSTGRGGKSFLGKKRTGVGPRRGEAISQVRWGKKARFRKKPGGAEPPR